MSEAVSRPDTMTSPSGASVMAELVRNKDWSDTVLGPRQQWPHSLRVSLDLILRSAYPMFIWWGPELVMFHNDAYLPVLGKKHPEALGQSAQQVWSEIWPDIGQVVADVFEGREFYAEDLLLYLGRKGFPEETYWTFSYSPVLNDEGAIGGLFCACNEETKKILRQRRLNNINRIASLSVQHQDIPSLCQAVIEVLESNPRDIPFSALYLIDEHNSRFSSIARSCADHQIALFPEVLHSGDGNDGVWNLQHLIQSGKIQIVNGLEQLLPPVTDGPDTVVRSAAMIPILKPGQQELAGVLIAGISPQLEYDNEYQSFLELTAVQISAAIADIRILEAERRRARALEEIDRAKTTFFSNVSHEFRTPLTLLINPLKDLLQHSNGHEQITTDRTAVEMIYRNASRLQKLVNDLLDFSRIEANRMQASFVPVDIAAYTAALSSNFSSAFAQAGLELILDIREVKEPVYLDTELWEKIVLNLLSNAFKYTFDGYVKISLHSDGPEQVVFQVEDSGAGIPQDDLGKIFERFHRVAGVRARSYEGTGIGLSLVQELIKIHHGQISVTSQLGQGTIFKVCLPTGKNHLPPGHIRELGEWMAQSADQSRSPIQPRQWDWQALGWDSAAAIIETDLPEQVIPEGANVKKQQPVILLADDNPDMRSYLQQLLASRFEVIPLENGRQVLDYLRHRRPADLILSDVMMPEMDGLELLDRVKSDAEFRHLPFILLSARAGEEARMGGLKHGADDYLVKPFSARELVARMEARLEVAALRNQAQQEEKARREQLTDIFRQAPAGIAILEGPELRYVLANPEYQQITQKTEAELLGQKLEMVFPHFQQSDLRSIFQKAYQNGEPYIGQEYLIDLQPKGPSFYHFVIQPIKDRAGQVTSLMLHITEVTDQVKAKKALEVELDEKARIEEALKKSEERFRRMADSVPVMIWLTAPDGQCSYLNKQWFDYSGETEERLIDFQMRTIVYEDDQAKVVETFMAANNTQTRFAVQYRLRNRKGEFRWHLASGLPKYDELGHFEGFIGTAVDIHERKLAEDLLLDKEEKLRLAVEATSLGTWDYYPLIDYLEWSDTCKDIFGMPRSEPMTYQKFLDCLHPQDRDRTDVAVRDALEDRQYYDIEYRVIRPSDQEERWIRATGDAYFNEGQEGFRLVGTAQDITERKLAEQQKDDFLRIAGHELRTPLTSVAGYLGLIQRLSTGNEKVKMYLEKSLQSIVKMRSLISDFLDISKVERGELAFELKPVDFSLLVRDSIESLQLAFLMHPIRLEVEDGIMLWADKDRMEQMLVNLVNNAVKYSPKGQPIGILLHSDGHKVNLHIKDQGIGMEEKEVDKIFSKFYRVASDNKVKGMGLGLYIVKKIVDFHQGTISVESSPQKGTVFSVEFDRYYA